MRQETDPAALPIQSAWTRTYAAMAQLRPDSGATRHRRALIRLSCALARQGVSGAALAALRRRASTRQRMEAA
ncbi:hypothetical protein [Streptomyces sp. NPDC056883]|uniref:hypothetical protein n=1 Tax=Streptomyces sp. NPDC056883 TaxID=3345959 RepID=UPI003697370E